MNNVEKLEQLGILADVRQRLGAKNEDDGSFDDRINKMSNSALIAKYSGWNLGDEGWWENMYHNFRELEDMDKA